MALIETEFDADNNNYWFYKKEKKFLHSIDTFYYTVTFSNDFSKCTQDPNVLELRYWLQEMQLLVAENIHDNILPVNDLPDLNDVVVTYTPKSFAGMFSHCLTVPEYFDVFLLESVPNEFTNHILVQIRSKALWLIGLSKSYEYSLRIVESVAKRFHLQIQEIKENRVDYCWHTNYLKNPEKFFRIDNFSAMQVSSFRDCQYHYKFKANSEYESDYVALGKRNSKCFVRIYLKTKEVVEQGYKPWFFKIWLLNNMISRYDYYVLTNLYSLRNWGCLDLIRLQYYYDYGTNQEYKDMCYSYMQSYFKDASGNRDSIANLADLLTPRITVIMNNEFQVMRKMSKSFCLVEHPKNDKLGYSKRIYDVLDNTPLITDYLTHSTLRLVEPSGDKNKSRRDYIEYWKRLRSAKIYNPFAKEYPNRLFRDYSRETNWDLMKSRFMHSAINFSLYSFGLDYQSENALGDMSELLGMLNDNDIHHANMYRYKRSKQLYPTDFKNKLEVSNGY